MEDTKKPSKADTERCDEYDGKYKDAAKTLSEAEKFGTDSYPVKHDGMPAKNLKTVGG